MDKLNKSVIRQTIVDDVSSMLHMKFSDERSGFWEHLKTQEDLACFLDHLLEQYVALYLQNDRGAHRHARFYIQWYVQANIYCSYCTDEGAVLTWWDKFVRSYPSSVTGKTRNTMMT